MSSQTSTTATTPPAEPTPLVQTRFTNYLANFPWWALVLALLGVLLVYSFATNSTYQDIIVYLVAGIRLTVTVTLVSFTFSLIIGLITAFLLMSEGATVTVCHHMTRSVAAHSRRADAVLVAVGIPRFLTADMIKPGAAVIDIGINQIADESGRPIIVGDVDTDAVKELASWVTPVPGGVGPVTVAMFMRNAVSAHDKQLRAGWLG